MQSLNTTNENEPLLASTAALPTAYVSGKQSVFTRKKLFYGTLVSLLVILTIAGFFSYAFLLSPSADVSNSTSAGALHSRLTYESDWLQIEKVSLDHRPSGWNYGEPCDDDTPFTLVIAAKQQNVKMLDELLMEVSNPVSPRYGYYYTSEEVDDIFAPSSETLDAIYEWLDYYGLKDASTSGSPNNDYIHVPVTCRLANQMLNTQYARWTHSETGQTHLRVKEDYFVPKSVGTHVDLLSPTLRFPMQTHTATRYFVSDDKNADHKQLDAEVLKIKDKYQGLKPSDFLDPVKRTQLLKSSIRSVLRAEESADKDDTEGQEQDQEQEAVAEGEGEEGEEGAADTDRSHVHVRGENRDRDDVSDNSHSHSDSDFDSISPDVLYKLYSMEDYIESAQGGDQNRQAVSSWLGEYYNDGDLLKFSQKYDVNLNTFERYPSSQEEGYGAEATLDVQYIAAMGRNIYTEVFYTEDETGSWILSFLNELRNADRAPYVISISYGAGELGSGEALTKRANDQLGQLALTGISFFVSSGDSGAAGDSYVSCSTAGYQPSFPATAPYVTAVGGVYGGHYPSSLDDNTNEIAWNYGGGGFSTIWDQQQWQKSAIRDYFNNAPQLPDAALYNAQGRGYPDISAQAVSYVIYYEDSWYSVSGTSASSPTIAGMVALINDLRIQARQQPIGFLNPALYALYDDDYNLYFNDVVDGYNEGCQADEYVGFSTSEGWDPVTGVGTPKFSRLAQGLINLGARKTQLPDQDLNQKVSKKGQVFYHA